MFISNKLSEKHADILTALYGNETVKKLDFDTVGFLARLIEGEWLAGVGTTCRAEEQVAALQERFKRYEATGNTFSRMALAALKTVQELKDEGQISEQAYSKLCKSLDLSELPDESA